MTYLRARLLLLPVVAAASLAPSAHAAAPGRIVALTPFSANTIASLGLRPVAVGQALGGPELFASSLASVPRLTLTHPAGPNLERLAAYRANLVFTAEAWQRGTPGMRRLGLRVADREPRAVTELPRQIERIGKLIGRPVAGRQLRRSQEVAIRKATRNIRRHPRVLLVLGVGSQTYAFLPNSWGGDVIRRAGGRLITGGLRASGGYARISDEFVVAKNPDVIIAVPHGTPSNIARIAAQLKSRPGWRTTRAARKGKVYISTSNTLLQPITGAAATLAGVRRIIGN